MSPDLAKLLAPRSIAFVGASTRANTPGHGMMQMIRRGGFSGIVTAVNPGYREVEGYACVPSLAELSRPPDLVVLSVKNERLEAALDAAIAVGARAAVIFASAHLERDGDPPLAARLAAKARAADMAICGANCMGFYNDLDRVWICGFPSPREPRPGAIALVAHSGSVFGALAHNDPRLRFALAVSPGQELTTTVADYVDYAIERTEVKVIGLFLETARDPPALRRAFARALQRGVPIVALKIGRTEEAAKAALTHTGAIAGSDAAWDALFDRYGVVRVDTLDELATSLMLFATGRRAGAGGLVSIHDSGGEREMLIDLAAREHVPFATLAPATTAAIVARLDPGLVAENPLDAWGTGADFVAQFTDCFTALLADPDAAAGLFAADLRDRYYLHDGFAAAALAAAATTTKPVAIATNYTQVRHDAIALRLSEAGVPVLDGTAHALVALRGLFAFRDALARAPDPPHSLPSDARRAAVLAALTAPGPRDETASLAALAAWEIPVIAHRRAATEADARLAAAQLGFPVALKTAAAGILHKSDSGGVRLDLASADAVAAAYRELSARLGPEIVVARMAPAGIELALGMLRDPQFGPVVSIGAGGTLIELLDDRVSALAPFGPATARRLIDRLRLRPLLDGYRGAPAVDLDALAVTIARFSVLAADLAPRVAEIDVNPLRCGAQIVAVDALLVVQPM